MPRARVRQEDVAEVPLVLELLDVLEEKGDAILEAWDGLEGEGERLPGLGSGQLFEAHGLLADAVPDPGREDLLRRQGEGPVREEVGEMAPELLEVFLPFLLDGLGAVDDEERPLKVVRKGDEPILGNEGQGRKGGAEFAPPQGRDFGVEVAGGAPAPFPGGRFPGLQEVGGRREFAERGHGQPVDPLEGPLGGDVELAQGGHGGPVELDAERVGLARGEDVDDASPPGVLAGRSDQVLMGVAVSGQGLEQGPVFDRRTGLEHQEKPGQVLAGRNELEEAGQRGDDDGWGGAQERPEQPHPRGQGVEGGRDLEVGVVGERRQDGRAQGGRETGDEEPALLLERRQGGRGGPDEDDRPADLAGQAGQDVGPGRVDDAVDRERPFAGGDGPDEVPELAGAKQEVEAHPAILIHRMSRVNAPGGRKP